MPFARANTPFSGLSRVRAGGSMELWMNKPPPDRAVPRATKAAEPSAVLRGRDSTVPALAVIPSSPLASFGEQLHTGYLMPLAAP